MDELDTAEQPEQPSGDRRRRVGPYRILAEIGEGGFGSVYLAEQEQPVRRQVALKVIKAGMDSRQVLARFEAERQALAVMDHPNIARVLDGGTTEAGRPYFVMDFVKGEPITAYCDRQALSIEARLALFIQVCDAVQHAHAKGIIHRDLKPANILVTSGDSAPSAKVIDFGIAKAITGRLTDRTVLTEQFMPIGTLEYMSPEQAEGSLDIDTRTDIYSLGVLLYELLAGSTPFDIKALRAGSIGEIQRAIRESEPETPSTRISKAGETATEIARRRGGDLKRVTSRVRGELDWIVLKAIEKDRLRRYETANGLAMDVKRYLAGDPVLAVPPTTRYRMGKFVRRHTAAVAAGALVAATLLMATGVSVYFAREARRRADAESIARARTDAINKFMIGILQSANVNAGGRQDVTVAESIDAALKRIESGAFSGDPVTESSLLATIAEVLYINGRAKEAVAAGQRALEIRRRIAPAGSIEIVASLVQLSLPLATADRSEEALARATEAVSMREKLAPGDDLLAGQTYAAMATAYASVEKFQQSVDYARRAIAAFERTKATPGIDLASAWDNLGNAQRLLSQFADAEISLRKAIEIYRGIGRETGAFAAAVHNLGIVHHNKGDYAKAEADFQEAIDIKHRLFKGDHLETAVSLDALGAAYLAHQQFRDAERVYSESLEMKRRLVGEEADTTLLTRANRAAALVDLGRAAEGVDELEAALAARRRHPEYPKLNLVGAAGGLARGYHALGRVRDERATFGEVLAMVRSQLPAQSAAYARWLWRSGSARLEDGDTAGAITELQESVTTAEKVFDRESPRLKQYRETLARAKAAKP